MSHTTLRSPLDYALAYARRGWRVFPLHSVRDGACTCGRETCYSVGKHPRTKNGVKDATSDETQVRAWWSQWPTANIGIATGIAEGATRGLYVIDVDIQKGANLDDLKDCDLATLLESLIARTGSGGYHIYLSTEQRLPNTCNRLAPFVDTRGEGGYVVAPPSTNRLGAYVWETRNPVLPIPDATLLTLNFMHVVTEHFQKERKDKHEISRSTQTHSTQEAQTRSDAPASDATAAVPQINVAGEARNTNLPGVASEARNNYLASMAGRLRGTGLNAAEICAMLATLNEERYGAGRHPQGPLTPEELRQTIFKSVARWEAECGVREQSQPVISDLADLMRRVIPEPRWLVEGLLCEGLILLAGKPKLGKSWLAVALALACAPSHEPQEPFLGQHPVERGDVLYVGLEDSEIRFQSRVRKLLGGRAVPSGFSFALTWKPLAQGGLQDLENWLSAAPNTRLVVVDPLARVRTPGTSGGNVYQEDYALMAALHEIASRYHIVLILIHHTRKLGSDDAFDEISGSIGLTGAADTSMVLKRERGKPEATLHLTGRDIEEQELALIFSKATCTWSCTGKAAERQQSKSRQAILDLLTEHGPMMQKDIVQALDIPKGTVYGTLARLMREKSILKESRGLYALPSQKEAQQEKVQEKQLTLEESQPEEPEPPIGELEELEKCLDNWRFKNVSSEDTGWPEDDSLGEYLMNDEPY